MTPLAWVIAVAAFVATVAVTIELARIAGLLLDIREVLQQPKGCPVAVAVDARGNPTVVSDDGVVWFWTPDPDKIAQLSPPDRMAFDMGRLTVGHKWVKYHSPIPAATMFAGGAE